MGTSLWLVADADETGKRCEQFLCAVEPGDEFALEVVKDSERDTALGGVPTNRGIITAGIFVNVSSAPTKVVRSRFKRMYPTNSNQGYMMVDQGKFNKTDFYQSTQIDDLDGIIVDGDDEASWRRQSRAVAVIPSSILQNSLNDRFAPTVGEPVIH